MIEPRIRNYEERSAVDILLLRDQKRMGRYRKRVSRDPAKRKLLPELALARIREMERDDFLIVGYRKRTLFIRGLSRT
jgi:hypothetical protein